MREYRRHCDRLTLVACAVLLAGLMAAMPAPAQEPPEYLTNFSAATVPPPDYCLRLENGVIHTMDAANTIVTSVLIQAEPVSATAAAWLVLEERISLPQALAMAGVVVALCVLAYTESRDGGLEIVDAVS